MVGCTGGFNADWDEIPDLHAYVEAIGASFAELQAACGPVRTASREPSAARAHA